MVDTTKERALAAHMAPRIKRAIGESGMTLEAIGESIGVSKAAVSKWAASGKIKMSNLLDLADITSKPPAWFFPGYDETLVDPHAAHQLTEIETVLRAAVASGDVDALEEALFIVLSAKRALN